MFLSENTWHIINHIIYDIYSSNDQQSMRKKFLENIELLIPYDKANFFLADSGDENHFISSPVSIGFTDDVYHDYHNTFEKFDYNKWIFATAQNDAFILSELMSKQDLSNNMFARGWLISKDIEHVLLLSLSYNNVFLGAASLFRMKKGEDFTQKDKKILNLLKNHLSLYLFKYSMPMNDEHKFSNTTLSSLAERYCLTPRETNILAMLIAGKKIPEICNELSISESTVRKHSSHIYHKMNVNNRNELNKICLVDL